MLEEFKQFALRGNMVDMAVGIVIGAAFGAMVSSLVSDLFTPIIGLLGGADFSNWFLVLREGTTAGPYATLQAAKAAGAVTLNIGVFLDTAINFLVVAVALFAVVKAMNALRRREEAAPVPPPGPTPTETLLSEIRDLLRTR